MILTEEALTALVVQVLTRHGLVEPNARIVAGSLVAAERDGAHSHGLLRLEGYVGTLHSFWVDGAAVPLVTDAAPGLVVTDAANGFAQVALAASAPLLREKARTAGLAALCVSNSHHFGALWPDIEPFAADGMIALTAVHARSRIVVWGGRRKVLGTNPMAFAFPRRGAPPVIWDQASSRRSQGEVLLARRSGRSVDPGVGLDAEGRPTTDPGAILDGGALLPFGDHKGASIALMVEVLAAALTGGRFGFEDRSAAYPGAQTTNAGQFVLLIDPERSAGTAFGDRIEMLVAQLRATGSERLPSDARYARREKSRMEGIRIGDQAYEQIRRLLGVAGS
ncbi:MAG: Ldh family oxidoreductase [Acetobacteraceae bacterium]